MTRAQTPQPEPYGMGIRYAVAFAFILMLGIVAYLTIVSLRPQWDILIVIGGLIGSLGPMTWSLLSFMKSEDGRAQSRQTYYQVNDRFDEFKRELEDKTQRLVREGYAAGLKDGSSGTQGIPIQAASTAEKTT